jgi:hypothetical protein
LHIRLISVTRPAADAYRNRIKLYLLLRSNIGSTMTEPNATRGFSGRRAPARGPLLPVALLLFFGAALAVAYWLARPQLRFTNGLIAPVRLTMDTDPPRTIGPGTSVRLAAPWRKSALVSWELVRPLSADGKPMGETLGGSLMLRENWGTTVRTVAARGSHGNYFAPLITNGTPDLLRIVVNAGLEGALDCGCAVRPDARRVFIGYYRLYQNSTVQATAPGPTRAVFRDLGSKVVSADGSVGLRFEEKDLRRQ